MHPDQRIVKIPIHTLWDAAGTLSLTRQRNVGREQVAELLRRGAVRFVVANVGDPLKWIPPEDQFAFWKGEVRPHLVEPEDNVVLEELPGEYGYFATEWGGDGAMPTVLLEMVH